MLRVPQFWPACALFTLQAKKVAKYVPVGKPKAAVVQEVRSWAVLLGGVLKYFFGCPPFRSLPNPGCPSPHDVLLQLHAAVECPLCIEPLDDTDRDFYPCPCG